MKCNYRVSCTALLFTYIHPYIKLLHHQMFTCMFAVDEGSLSVFQHVNSLAMHVNMSLRLPGSPQSLPDGTMAQKAELKALLPHTIKVEARNQYRLNVQVHCFFFCSCLSMILIEVPVCTKRKCKNISSSASRLYFMYT